MPTYAEQYAFPASNLSQLLDLVSMTAKASALIDIIPAVLRSGEPYAMSVELEAFIEEAVSRCPLSALHLLPAVCCPLFAVVIEGGAIATTADGPTAPDCTTTHRPLTALTLTAHLPHYHSPPTYHTTTYRPLVRQG